MKNLLSTCKFIDDDSESCRFLPRRGYRSKPRVASAASAPWVDGAFGISTLKALHKEHATLVLCPYRAHSPVSPEPRVRLLRSRPWATLCNPFGVKKLRIRRLSFVLAATLLAFMAGCTSTPPPTAKVQASALTVGKPKPLRRVIEQPASFEGFEETPLVAHISGYVEKVPADIGMMVTGPRYDAKGKLTKPGDVLAELSIPEMLSELQEKTARVKQAQAEVDQASAALEAAEARILTAKAQVREAESARVSAEANYQRWKSEYTRFVDLVASNVVDKQTRDEALNKYKAAEANRVEVEAKVQSAQALVVESEAKRSQAKADIAAARARVLVTQAEEGRLAALVEYRYIRAPFDGVVTRRNIHTGYFLQPNASGGPGVLFIVARTDKLRIVSEIPESDASYIKDDLSAKILVPVLKEQTFQGKIARTSGTLDMKSRTLRIEIDYDNKAGKLRPGMYANVIFTAEPKDRYTLPASAIFTHADQPCCYRIEDGKAQRTPLKLGARDGQHVEVLMKQTAESTWTPISGQEEIILTNLGSVSDGKEVAIERK